MRTLIRVCFYMCILSKFGEGALLSQTGVGNYYGGFEVIYSPADSATQASYLKSHFSYCQDQWHWRSDVYNPTNGMVISIGDKKSLEIKMYINFQGHQRCLKMHGADSNPMGVVDENSVWQEGHTELIEGDTILAGVACKRAKWHAKDHELKPRTVWFAPDIPCDLPQRFPGLPGMPILFDFELGAYIMRYEILGLTYEQPSQDMFSDIAGYEEIEQLINRENDQKK
jgi:hypothetical protein